LNISSANFFGDVAPKGDDLVVAFTVGDGAVEILLLHFDDFTFCRVDQFYLVARDEHVVDADGDAGLGCIGETQFLQAIKQDHRAFETIVEVREVHQLLNALFLEQAIE